AVVLVVRPGDQPQPPGAGDQGPGGRRAGQVVVAAVPAAGPVAHLEPVGQALEGRQHLLDAAHLGAADDLPVPPGAQTEMRVLWMSSPTRSMGASRLGSLGGAPPTSTLPDRQRAPTSFHPAGDVTSFR